PPVFVQKMADQRQNILLSFTEGRNGDRNHIESKIQVLPETSFPHQIFQVSIGGGDQTEIRFLWPGTPNPVISLFLNKLQHLHLGRKGKFTDLVQKQGTSVGPFGKSRFALAAGPGKGRSE